MARIVENSSEVAAEIAGKRAQIASAVAVGMRSALIAVDKEAVKNRSGSNSDAPGAYPIPVRAGELRRDETIQQPSPGIGLIFFNARYANAIETGDVTRWAGRGKTKRVQVAARPFAQDAVDKADPTQKVIDSVSQVFA